MTGPCSPGHSVNDPPGMHLRNATVAGQEGETRGGDVPPSLSVSLVHRSPLPSPTQDPVCGLVSTPELTMDPQEANSSLSSWMDLD